MTRRGTGKFHSGRGTGNIRVNIFRQLAETCIRMLANVWRFYKVFVAPPKTYRSPRRSRVLIFDASWTDLLLLFLKPWTPEILHLRQECINVPCLLRAALNRNFWKGDMVTAYIDAFIRCVQPDLIVTMIDNDVRFYTLSQRHPRLKTVVVQNAWRDDWTLQGLRLAAANGALQASCMCFLGANIEAEYRKLVSCETIRVGQIKNNLVPKTVFSATKQTIGFVSQYRHPDTSGTILQWHLFPWQKFFEEPDTIVLTFLKDYAARTNRNLLVLANPTAMLDPLHCEEAYFRRLLGDGYDFFAPRDTLDSCAKTDACEVVVSIDSTLGLEAVARGNRAALFYIRSEICNLPDSRFGWPAEYADDGPFWSNVPDPAIFERIMDFLFAASDAEWRETLRQHNFERIMEYDPGNTRFKHLLTDILGPTPVD